MRTYSVLQFHAFPVENGDAPQFTTTTNALALAHGEWPEAFKMKGQRRPFYLMDVVGSEGWYTQGRGAQERTAFVTVHQSV